MNGDILGVLLVAALAYAIGGTVGHTIGDICRLVLRKPRGKPQ